MTEPVQLVRVSIRPDQRDRWLELIRVYLAQTEVSIHEVASTLTLDESLAAAGNAQ